MCSSSGSKDEDARERRFLKLWRHVKGYRQGPDLIKDLAHRSEITVEKAKELIGAFREKFPFLGPAGREFRQSLNYLIQSQVAEEDARDQGMKKVHEKNYGSFTPKNLMIFEDAKKPYKHTILLHNLKALKGVDACTWTYLQEKLLAMHPDKLCKDCKFWESYTEICPLLTEFIILSGNWTSTLSPVSKTPPSFGCILWERREKCQEKNSQ